MSALFSPRSNALFRLVLVLLVAGAVGSVAGAMVYWRTPYGTGQQQQVAQPIQFDHRHHVKDDLIDCRYCHYDRRARRRAPASRPPSCA